VTRRGDEPLLSHIGLGPGPEFDRIRAIIARLGPDASGIGDDCAAFPIGGTNLVASIDCSIEGVHFRTDWLTAEEIGYRAAAAALSDLAAEGAEPVGVLVSLGLPGDGKRDAGDDVMGGVGAAVVGVGAHVLGGDLVRSDKIIVDVCVLGTAARPVRRAGANAGDGMWVTGTLGGAGLALARLQAAKPLDAKLRARYARPEPRIAAGQWLAAHGATAMIDISDGLAQDAGQLAAASGVAVEIALEHLPCWPGVTPAAAAASGEEFELLVTLPAEFAAAAQLVEATGLTLTRIGACVAGSGLRMRENGQRITAPPGFDHFA
jgi:thiamine-monophosphate kinase